MLKFGQYLPDLETMYDQDRLPGNGRNGNIRFLETTPEKIKDTVFPNKLSKKQKEYYVSIGFAKWNTYEYERQLQIHMFIRLSSYSTTVKENFKKAIERKDRVALYNYFQSKNKATVKRHMLKLKHTQEDTDEVLRLLFKKEKNNTLKQIIQTLNKTPDPASSTKIYQVLLFNCKCHAEYQIVNEIMNLFVCTLETAINLVTTAEKSGHVSVFTGDKRSCDVVAAKLEESWITVEVREL